MSGILTDATEPVLARTTCSGRCAVGGRERGGYGDCSDAGNTLGVSLLSFVSVVSGGGASEVKLALRGAVIRPSCAARYDVVRPCTGLDGGVVPGTGTEPVPPSFAITGRPAPSDEDGDEDSADVPNRPSIESEARRSPIPGFSVVLVGVLGMSLLCSSTRE